MTTAKAGRYNEILLSSAGTPLPNTAVSVRLANTTTPATLYTDENKTAAAPNPTTTDAFGNLSFWADWDSHYDLVANGTTIEDVAVTPTLAALSGTFVLPAHLRTSLKDTRVGAVLDGVADDTAKLQTAVDLMGDTSTLRGGGLFHPGGRARTTAMVTIDRKTLSFEGVGPGGSGGGGSLVVWDGIAGQPMFRVRRSWGLRLQGLRFVGKSTAKPASAISLYNAAGDANVNTFITLEDLWVGSISGFDADNATQFERGIYVEGNNVQNDQSSMRNIVVQGASVAGIELSGSQNVIWELATIIVNAATVGFRSSTRHTVGTNWFFSSNATADIEFPGDASAKVTNFGSEGSARLIRALSGADIDIDRGYFQANASIPADGAVVELGAAGGSVVLRLCDFSFTRSVSPWTFAQEKIRVRTAKALIVLDNVSLPGPPATVLDLTTTTAGETRHVILRNVTDSLTGTRYNGEYRWTHGAAVPNLNDGATEMALARIGDGTQALPGLAFTGDPDTGIYRQTANGMSMVVGGALALALSGGVASFNADLRPTGTNSADMGTAALRWRSLYLSGIFDHSGASVGFYGTAPIAKQTAVPVTAAGVHAALVALGLIS